MLKWWWTELDYLITVWKWLGFVVGVVLLEFWIGTQSNDRA